MVSAYHDIYRFQGEYICVSAFTLSLRIPVLCLHRKEIEINNMAPAPIAVDSIDESFSNVSLKGQNGSSERTQSLYHTQGPIKPTGILDQYEHFDLTPVIGREFPDANLVDWINSPNADELLKELAVTSTYCPSIQNLHA